MIAQYFRTLVDRFGTAWNRFWFVPSQAWTLSAIRVLAGLAAIYVHATLTPDLARLFAPDGLLPGATMVQLRGTWTSFSYLSLVSGTTELYAAHFLGLVVLAVFTVGLATRFTSILSLIVTLSYIHRGPIVTSLGEPILTVILFYLCLAPCGRHFSLDSLLKQWKARRQVPLASTVPPTAPSTAVTVASRLLQVHLAAVYLAMAVGKLAAASTFNEGIARPWWTGDAIWWLVARPESRLADLTWLHSYPLLYSAWTHAVVLFEASFGILIWNRLARPLLLAAAFVMWPLLAIVTGQTAFCMLMVIGSLAFVPPEVMRRLLVRGEALSDE